MTTRIFGRSNSYSLENSNTLRLQQKVPHLTRSLQTFGTQLLRTLIILGDVASMYMDNMNPASYQQRRLSRLGIGAFILSHPRRLH
jgi:hypothetical protein